MSGGAAGAALRGCRGGPPVPAAARPDLGPAVVRAHGGDGRGLHEGRRARAGAVPGGADRGFRARRRARRVQPDVRRSAAHGPRARRGDGRGRRRGRGRHGHDAARGRREELHPRASRAERIAERGGRDDDAVPRHRPSPRRLRGRRDHDHRRRRLGRRDPHAGLARDVRRAHHRRGRLQRHVTRVRERHDALLARAPTGGGERLRRRVPLGPALRRRARGRRAPARVVGAARAGRLGHRGRGRFRGRLPRA